MMTSKYPRAWPSLLGPMRVFFTYFVLISAIGINGLLIQGCEAPYILKQGYYQAKLLKQKKDVGEVLSDPSVSLQVKEKIRFIEDVCEFASKRLDLETGVSYKCFIELQGDELGYVISACPKDSLEPHVWSFPLVGEFPYKGFFLLEDALEEKRSLELKEFDVHLGKISAFSALGWFGDPIYSTMLRMNDWELAQTIFHELVHKNIFFKNKVEFNEQIATFIGWEASVKFFEWRHGGNSWETLQVLRAVDAEKALCRYLEKWRSKLQKLYSSPLSRPQKLLVREELFSLMASEARDLAQTHPRLRWLESVSWNNASFMALWRYRYDVGNLELIYSSMGRDLEALILTLKKWNQMGCDPEVQLHTLLPEGK